MRFKYDLREQLGKNSSYRENFEVFNATVLNVLDKHAPITKNVLFAASVRANDGPFMTETLRKAIMDRTRLRNTSCNNRTVDNLKAFKKQRNTSVKILRQAKRDYYNDLDIKDLTDNKKFWK